MKKGLIIFGTGKISDVIYYYAKEECGLNVVGFASDNEYVKEPDHYQLPVIPFDEIEKKYPPADYDMFIAVGYQDLNNLREKKYNEAKSKGYNLISIISPKANLPKNIIYGDNCFIMPPCVIHPCVSIENNVFVWSGAVVGHHSTIKSHCWITSGSNIGGNVILGENTFIAINATIGHSVCIGKNCFIGANTLITKNAGDQTVFIHESNKPLRLNSEQFLKLSKFSSI